MPDVTEYREDAVDARWDTYIKVPCSRGEKANLERIANQKSMPAWKMIRLIVEDKLGRL